MPLEAGLLEILACPACHAPLREQHADPQPSERTAPGDDVDSTELACTAAQCGLVYPVRDGIPVLLVDEARRSA
ncbi:Trm112 family protein [Streptomyces sp. URMC 123]|uniref:Trm112 family protein n=1 Tax=Streptomyces sp. URMC 123 TaxID=3423403 RepID=UPI003F1A582A